MNRRERPVGRWPPAPRPEPAPEPVPESGGRHCWVLDPPGLPGRWPGLLTQWRRDRRGWSGFVIFTATLEGRPVIVQDWIDARHLRGITPEGAAPRRT